MIGPPRLAVAAVVAAACCATMGLDVARAPAPADPVLATRPSFRPVADTPQGAREVAETSSWLRRGSIPGSGGEWEDMSRDALMDLHRLLYTDGAVAAGAADRWSYVWPRDSAFAAVALVRTGHPADAQRVLGFLARVPFDPEQGFEARYLLDGTGPPDARPRQSDGCGWVMWAVDHVSRGSAAQVSTPVRSMLSRCGAFVLRITGHGRHLPSPSPDYWEVPVGATSLGSVAPLYAGLLAGARAERTLSDPVDATVLDLAATRLGQRITATFGRSWERFGDTGGMDAAVTFMMPPFASETPGVATAWQRYQREAVRPGGGLAPGVAWKHDGVSWTPETALVAYTAAASGRIAVARRWLHWLDEQRTSWGSLPEKVTAGGRPAGPAPLAWTAALVLLTLDLLDPEQPLSTGGAPGLRQR